MRMLKLEMTDGVNTFSAIEHEKFPEKFVISVNNKCFLNPNPPIQVRRGVLMLKASNI